MEALQELTQSPLDLFKVLKGNLEDERVVKFATHLIKSNSESPCPFSWLICEEESRDSLLHLVAKKNNSEIAELLLNSVRSEIIAKKLDRKQQRTEYNNYLNSLNSSGNSPLHLACEYAQFTMVNFLIKEGADLFQLNEQQEEPLVIAINHHTEEEHNDSERTASRLKTIKALLQYNLGLGVENLTQLLKNKNIIPPANEYKDLNVIASGTTHADPGFEEAICSLKDFIEILNQKNNYEFEENFKRLFEVAQKRLYQKTRQQSPVVAELKNFIRFADHRMPKGLQRLCLRYIVNHKVDFSAKVNADLTEKLTEMSLIHKVTPNLNSVVLLLESLNDLAKQIDDTLDGEVSSFQRAQYIRNISFILSLSIIFFGTASYVPVSAYLDDVFSAQISFLVFFTLMITLSIAYCCWRQPDDGGGIPPLRRLWASMWTDPDTHSISLTEFNAEFSTKKNDLQPKIDTLVTAGVVVRESSQRYYNATHSLELKTAINRIMLECENYFTERAETITLEEFCKSSPEKNQTHFFMTSEKINQQSSGLIVEELDDGILSTENEHKLTEVVTENHDDETTLLLGGPIRNWYGVLTS